MSSILKHNKHQSRTLASRKRRQVRGRKKIHGSAVRPRLIVVRSLRHVTAQVVDDTTGTTLASATSIETGIKTEGDKTAQAREVGRLVGERAKAAGIETVVFDRAGRKYHGRIAALAEGARGAGLDF
jgi:large subunit ribosomal protein L18